MVSTVNSNGTDRPIYVVSQILVLVGKILGLLLLSILLAFSLVIWFWVAAFRSGWRFGQWTKEYSSEMTSVGFLYGLIVIIVTPFLLFLSWIQTRLEGVQWIQSSRTSSQSISVRQLFEERLGIELGKELPFFIEQGPSASEPKALPEEKS